MGSEQQVIEADLVWLDDRFESNVTVIVDDAGRIDSVAATTEPASAPTTRRLAGCALLPGFVNAHSHAFQRGLRGQGETFPGSAGSFWSWREQMYRLVEQMDEQRCHELSLIAFNEMRAAGITTVGEFHYLHHAGDEASEDFALDPVVLRAARDAGIRLVLLNTFYKTGGIGQPLAAGQHRFSTPSLGNFLRRTEALATDLEPSTQSLGIAAHSIRAVPREELAELHHEASRREMVFHMHLEEQPKEIEAAQAAYGRTPSEIVLDCGLADHRFTAVHCTQTTPGRLARLLESGSHLCLCPLTEANLGDGIPDGLTVADHGAAVCIGTDSNARLCFTEEMRWLEYVQRLTEQQRGVCVDADGRVATRLLACSTVAGADALGLPTGCIEPGRLADFVAIDLEAPSLRGWERRTLLESLVFGAGNDAIKATCVGGHWREHRP